MFVFLGTQKSCTRRAWEGIPTGLVHSSFAYISCFYFLFYEQRLSSSSLVNLSSVTNIIIIKINIITTIMVILSLIIIIFVIIISIILKNLHLCHHLIIIIIAITGQHHQDHYCTISLPIIKIVQNVFSFLIGFNPITEMFYITSRHWPYLKDVKTCHYFAVATNCKIFDYGKLIVFRWRQWQSSPYVIYVGENLVKVFTHYAKIKKPLIVSKPEQE